MTQQVQGEAARRGITTHYGKRLTGLDQDADSVTAHFADGSSATGDILVGADGIHSAVRPAIDPAAPTPRYTGLLFSSGWLCSSSPPWGRSSSWCGRSVDSPSWLGGPASSAEPAG
jgi:2-polyprenyl-6-methoxyphenol hydroxylase-like FAD-dependent oxidoreductase